MRASAIRISVLLGLSLTVAGCIAAPTIAPRAPQPPPAAAESRYAIVTARPGLPMDLHWFRNSAERVASFEQTYSLARARIDALAPGLAGKNWGVIIDADETLLDNSDYQARLVIMGQPHNEDIWAIWTADRRAGLLPGAAAFVSHVHAAGGRVVVVTNRREALCEDTRANIDALGVRVDGVLCAGASSEKETRFAAVAAGTTNLGLPALEVVMFIGDNIKDCPGQTQARHDPEVFGTRCFILPNPMYGSWVGNPYR